MPCTRARDHARIGHAGHEDAVRSRVEVGPAALDRALESRRRVADLPEEDVGAGVEDERNAGLVADLRGRRRSWRRTRSIGSRGPRLPSLRSSRLSPTAPTSSDAARGGGSGLGLVAVAGLHVGGDGQVDRAGDRGDRSEHLLAGEVLAVGVAEGIGAPALDVAIARAPARAITTALAASHALRSSSGSPGTWRSRSASALARWSMA